MILAFRHVPFEGLGLIEPELRSRGFEIHYADLYDASLSSPAIPDPASCEALIFLGGPMSVNDDLAWLRREEEYIRQAVARDTPILGVCLGAQLISRALGGVVRHNRVKEIGWFEIWLTPAAALDPLFAGLPARDTVFHWHGETFSLPPGAELLASSERCVHQAFRLGHSVYGLQYHLEVTPGMIADWCRQDENCGDVRELDGPVDPQYNAARLRELSSAVFGRWCDIVLVRTAAKAV